MSGPPSAVDRGCGTAARLVVGVALVAVGAMKLSSLPVEHSAEIFGIAGVLATQEATLVAAGVEVGLGVALLSPYHPKAAWPLVLWLSALAGIVLASLVAGVRLEGCGCVGPISFTPAGRAATVLGLCALTWVWVAAERGPEEGPGTASAQRAS
jgi:hypothetical protein